MQLAGPNVMGAPRDVDAAVAVLRAAIALGMNHNERLLRTSHHKSDYPTSLCAVLPAGWVHAATILGT
ncbi:hypothetical protein [Nostoc sp.]|uniref:hypothetical protein n=1 Tax=Nostoc sp. TaxID=1180 RepID=UPI002FF93759